MSRRPHKKQRGEGSSQQPRLIQGKFTSPRAMREYSDWICKTKFMQERGLEIEVPTDWNWSNFLAQPQPGIASVVREFYANARDAQETDRCIVRGIEVDFSEGAINAYYGTNSFRMGDYYHHRLQEHMISQSGFETIAKFFNPEARWNVVRDGMAHIDYGYFNKSDRALMDFVKSRLSPWKHTVHMKPEIILLTYCIRKQWTINIGHRIHDRIREIASSEGKHRVFLAFPSLITELCRQAGVPIGDNETEFIAPLPHLTKSYIRQNYKNGEYVVEAEEEQEEDTMELDTSYSSRDFDEDYPFRQQQLRNQEERALMEMNNALFRQTQDTSWYEAQHIYGHHQISLGHQFNFPPPPPWFDDPNFIPEYQRHPPPPPQ